MEYWNYLTYFYSTDIMFRGTLYADSLKASLTFYLFVCFVIATEMIVFWGIVQNPGYFKGFVKGNQYTHKIEKDVCKKDLQISIENAGLQNYMQLPNHMRIFFDLLPVTTEYNNS